MESSMISCLCVTHKKPDLLFRAVQCFLSQTYQNKELIIVYDDDDEVTKEKLHNYANEKIRVYEADRTIHTTLGSIRNLAIAKASGQYICQWDDDDWYHKDRLKIQHSALINSGKKASVLTKWFILNSLTREAYLSRSRTWEGSLICEREMALNIGYLNVARGEEKKIIKQLTLNEDLHLLKNAAYLYVYNYHAKNTWDAQHWRDIFFLSTKLQASDALQIFNINNSDIQIYNLSNTLEEIHQRLQRLRLLFTTSELIKLFFLKVKHKTYSVLKNLRNS